MANYRMFNKEIIQSDQFIALPLSAQALYIHLCLSADDDGMIGKPLSLLRMIGATMKDMESLIVSGFMIEFQSGIMTIRHWLSHNRLRKDRYKPTIYFHEFSQLIFSKELRVYYLKNEEKYAYLAWLPQSRVEENRIEKSRVEEGIREEVKKTNYNSQPTINKNDDRNHFGDFNNVILYQEEFQKIINNVQGLSYINKLSYHMKSTGKNYESHYATILRWMNEDNQRKKNPNEPEWLQGFINDLSKMESK